MTCSNLLNELIIIGRSVRGASHVLTRKVCQDYYRTIRTPNYAIVAVADGHGSAECPYSDEGAKIATDVFETFMENYIDGNYGKSLYEILFQEAKLEIPKKIVAEWKRQVCEHHLKMNRKVLNNDELFIQYGTTLLGLVITSDFVFGFQIGDGDIIYIDDESIVPVTDAVKLPGVETYSLSSQDAWQYSTTTIKKIQDEKSFLYILTTDGVSNSYIDQENFYISCKDYFKILDTDGVEYVNQNLSEWLTDINTKGSGDDVTALLLYYKMTNEIEK